MVVEQARSADAKTRIFISYSRKDREFADRLVAGLAARGFEPLIDRAEIYAFEDWWQRIEALISRADTVVFVLSPNAVFSDVALKEVAYAASLNKRFAPIVLQRVEDAAVPEPLRRLNFIFFDDFFDGSAHFEKSADELGEALQRDIGWIRQHTEYGEAARRWLANGRSEGLLLRSPMLEQAERWIVSPPRGTTLGDANELTREFIAASRAAEVRRRDHEHKRRTAILSATGGMSMRTIPFYRALVLALTAIAVIVRFQDPVILQRLRALAFDTYQRISPAPYDAQLPVRIVDIDERSLRVYGQWPWPRTRIGDLVKILGADGVAAIVFDLQFSDPDRWSLKEYVKTLPRDQAALLNGATGASATNDEILAASLRQAPSVVSVALDNAGNQTGSANDLPRVTEENCPLAPFGKAGFAWAGNCPAPFIANFTNAHVLAILAQASSGVGAVTYLSDPDNIIRRVGLVYREGNLLVPGLAAEAIRVSRGAPGFTINSSNASGETAFGQRTGINHIDIGELEIPTDGRGEITVKYRHTNPHAFISAAAVLNGEVAADAVAGRIIFIGTTAAGAVDLHPTPVDAAVPGVEIHAQVAENILSGTELVRPDYILAVEELMVLAIVAILAIATPRLSARWLASLSALVLIVVVGGGWAAYYYASVLIDPVYPTITLVAFITVITFYIYRHSEAQRGRIRGIYNVSTSEND